MPLEKEERETGRESRGTEKEDWKPLKMQGRKTRINRHFRT